MVMTTKDDIFFNPTMLAAYTSEVMAKGYVTAKYLKRQVSTAPTVITYIKEDETDGKLMNSKNKKVRPVSEGTELTEVRGSERLGRTKELTLRGFKLSVTDQELENDAFSLEDNIRDMSYTLARTVEQDAINTLINEANSPKVTVKGNWADSATTLNDIQSDLIDMQSAYDDTDYVDTLNCMFFNKKQFNAIRKGLNYEVSNYDVEAERGYNPYQSNPSLSFVDGVHHISKFLDDGECLGFDANNPPATIFYNVDPKLGSPAFYQGLEDYAPFVRTYVRREEGVVPKTEIEMAVSYAITVNKPAALLYAKGL